MELRSSTHLLRKGGALLTLLKPHPLVIFRGWKFYLKMQCNQHRAIRSFHILFNSTLCSLQEPRLACMLDAPLHTCFRKAEPFSHFFSYRAPLLTHLLQKGGAILTLLLLESSASIHTCFRKAEPFLHFFSHRASLLTQLLQKGGAILTLLLL